MKLKKLVPMLNVSGLEASLEFYRKALGFEVVSPPEAVKEWRWANIRSGETELMLSETDFPPKLERAVEAFENTGWPTIFYFYPDDVELLFRHVTGMGIAASPLQVTFYGMKEFTVRDSDGHLLTFGQDA